MNARARAHTAPHRTALTQIKMNLRTTFVTHPTLFFLKKTMTDNWIHLGRDAESLYFKLLYYRSLYRYIYLVCVYYTLILLHTSYLRSQMLHVVLFISLSLSLSHTHTRTLILLTGKLNCILFHFRLRELTCPCFLWQPLHMVAL